jgi:hypothetical protein
MIARWHHIFHTKITIWAHFGGHWNGKCWNRHIKFIWYILWPFVHTAVWYTYIGLLRPFGIFCGILISFGMLNQENIWQPWSDAGSE